MNGLRQVLDRSSEPGGSRAASHPGHADLEVVASWWSFSPEAPTRLTEFSTRLRNRHSASRAFKIMHFRRMINPSLHPRMIRVSDSARFTSRSQS
nr:hypothetical protein Itr_chr05CG11390 [Ipomoea trifida]